MCQGPACSAADDVYRKAGRVRSRSLRASSRALPSSPCERNYTFECPETWMIVRLNFTDVLMLENRIILPLNEVLSNDIRYSNRCECTFAWLFCQSVKKLKIHRVWYWIFEFLYIETIVYPNFQKGQAKNKRIIIDNNEKPSYTSLQAQQRAKLVGTSRAVAMARSIYIFCPRRFQ